MNESVAVAKEADMKKGFSPTKSDSSIHRARNESEKQFGSLRGVIANIRRNGGTPSVESIATELSGMHTAQRAPMLLALQQTHGNRYVQRVVSGIQAKLKVGQPGGMYEQEADRIADEVMRMPEPQVQRACAFSGEYPKYRAEQLGRNHKLLQNKPIQANNDEGMTAPPIVHKVLRSPGQQLDPSTKAFFEQRFGHNFSQVRVHTGTVATVSAQAINAKAFTVGKNIVFGHGQYSPQSDKGRRLLAHELVHTVQQGATGRSPSSQPATIYRYVNYDVIDSLSRTDLPGGVGDTGAAERILLGLSDEDFTDTMVAVRDMGQLEYLLEYSRPVRTRYYQLHQAEQHPEQQERQEETQPERAIPQTGPQPGPTPVCTTRYQRATNFQSLIDLVRAAETRLNAAGITSTREQIHALRGIYYGTTWSQDYAVERSTTRNEGFQRFTRPSLDPSRSIPRDVQPLLDCGLFVALRSSQDITDGSRHVDFGHLIIGLDARYDPAFSSNIQYPVMLMSIDMGGTGPELVTWLGDLGGGAAALASRRVSTPGTNARSVFTGTDYGGSINLEGDIAGFVVATSGRPRPTAPTAPAFAPGRGRFSDALEDYLSPSTPSHAWTGRATTFLRMYGGTFDASSNALTNSPTLITTFSGKIQIFACNYLASRVRDGHMTYAEARAAAAHVIPASREVATAFVNALEDSHGTGSRIEARRFPSPSPASPGACAQQLVAAGLLGTLSL